MIPRSHVFLSALLKQLRDDAGPTSLMTGADAAAVVAMKVFVEEDEIFPVRVVLEFFDWSVHGTRAICVGEKNRRKTAGNLLSNFPECQKFSRTCRALDL